MSSPHFPTRILLICAALAAVHALLHLATVPLLTALAPLSPPLYGLLAGVHSLVPFLARRVTATLGTATITAGIASVFVSATSPSGLLVAIPLMIAGVTIDAVVGRSDRAGPSRRSEIRYMLAAVVAGTLLFAVSLSVFSPEHLTPLLITSTLATRLVGELTAATVSMLLARALRRAGIGGLRRPPDAPQ